MEEKCHQNCMDCGWLTIYYNIHAVCPTMSYEQNYVPYMSQYALLQKLNLSCLSSFYIPSIKSSLYLRDITEILLASVNSKQYQGAGPHFVFFFFKSTRKLANEKLSLYRYSALLILDQLRSLNRVGFCKKCVVVEVCMYVFVCLLCKTYTLRDAMQIFTFYSDNICFVRVEYKALWNSCFKCLM